MSLNAHMCYYIECWLCCARFGYEACCSWFCTTDAIQGKVCLHYISVCQLLSLCNCGANHNGVCLGTCRTFMVTMLNCCRGELALSSSLCIGWHKRNLSSLAAASWRQEMGFFETQRRSVGWKEDEKDFQGSGGMIIAVLWLQIDEDS